MGSKQRLQRNKLVRLMPNLPQGTYNKFKKKKSRLRDTKASRKANRK